MLRKLVIQVPCYNEASTLPVTWACLPRELPGVGTIETLVINDGSTDETVAVATALGADHILDLRVNRGLAATFMAGIEYAFRLGADCVINLDADNQYDANDIPVLLASIQDGTADIVVGERPYDSIQHFSATKKRLQRLGSWLVSTLSHTTIRDTQSGYRAFNRKAMMSLVVHNPYTYTHESLIAAHDLGLRVVGVPIHVNPGALRPSRLMRSMFEYVYKSGFTIVRFYLLYNPYALLCYMSLLCALGAVIAAGAAISFYGVDRDLAVISAIVFGTMVSLSVAAILAAMICDIVRINRRLLQRCLYEIREQQDAVRERSCGHHDP
jgi:glycosyltransferase involved in cell wall biosynthesis